MPAQLAACGSDADGHSAAGTRSALLGEPSTIHVWGHVWGHIWGHVTKHLLMCIVGYLTFSMIVT